MAVYFIQNTETLHIKIGVSNDVDSRLKSIQTATHHQLILLGVINGGRPIERSLHDKFQSKRIHGEWFSGDIAPTIQLICEGKISVQPFQPIPQPGRTGISKMFYLDDELSDALADFITTHEFQPTQTRVLSMALKEFLRARGYYPPKKNGK